MSEPTNAEVVDDILATNQAEAELGLRDAHTRALLMRLSVEKFALSDELAKARAKIEVLEEHVKTLRGMVERAYT